MATGDSANAAMVGQIGDSVQTSSLEMSPGASSESTLETAQRTRHPIQSDAEARATIFAPRGDDGASVTATGISREFSEERFEGNDRGRAILLPIQQDSPVVPRLRSRSPTPVAERTEQQVNNRSSEHASQSMQMASSRQSGRSTPKGGGNAESSFRIVGGADERLEQELRKTVGLSASPGSRSNCSATELPPGTPEHFDITSRPSRYTHF